MTEKKATLEDRVKKLEDLCRILVKDAKDFRKHKRTPDAHNPAVMTKARTIAIDK